MVNLMGTEHSAEDQSPPVQAYVPPVQYTPSAQAPVEAPAPGPVRADVQIPRYAQPVEAPSVPAKAPRYDVLTVTVTNTKVVQHIDPQGHAMLLAKASRKDAPGDRFSLICHTAKSSCTMTEAMYRSTISPSMVSVGTANATV